MPGPFSWKWMLPPPEMLLSSLPPAARRYPPPGRRKSTACFRTSWWRGCVVTRIQTRISRSPLMN